MLPSKSMIDYMTEMHRLFPELETAESPTPLPFNAYQQMYQSAVVNRSSSSTDSTSPESYPDLSGRYSNYRPLENITLQDTPFRTRPQRAIVGRKITGSSPQTSRLMTPEERLEREFNVWQHDESLSPTPGIPTPSKSFYYELFSSDNKSFEFKTPTKSEPTNFDFSPNLPDRSPLSNSKSLHIKRNISNLSPMSNQPYRSQSQLVPVSVLSPTWSNSSHGSIIPSQSEQHNFMGASSPSFVLKNQSFGTPISTDQIAPSKMCTFCRKNGETPIVYMTHRVKEQVGNKNVVTCPILRSHVCVACSATGDNAHTITYCPVLRTHNNGKPLQSTTVTLKNTRIKSNGKRRY